jgi:hypothetical protein
MKCPARPTPGTHRSPTLILLVGVLLFSGGCSSTFAPQSLDEVDLHDRAQTQEQGNVRVTTLVPSAKETQQLFSFPLYKARVQPVWLEIQNDRDEAVSFLAVGLDAGYFSPIEAANRNMKEEAKSWDDARSRYFVGEAMPSYIPAGETRSGYVFTPLDEGTKAFNVDVLGAREAFQFTFFIPVPGLKVDHHDVDWDNIYSPDEIEDLDAAGLIEALEAVPPCASDKKGTGTADPLNLVVIGDLDDVYHAFIRAGWDETETIHRGSLWKTALSFVSGGEYRYSPVSSLYLFGRKQEVAFQAARDNIHERNHLRLWMAPVRFEGKPVWIGQISRDIGVRFTRKTITTHKIDPDVDETREFLVENLAYSQALAKLAYVGGVGAASIDAPRGNLTGDPYFTDGYRAVLWVSSSPVGIADIEIVDWRTPPGRHTP